MGATPSVTGNGSTATFPLGIRRNDHNVYRDHGTASLLANLESRLWDCEEIAANMEADPDSWHGGAANIDFCNVQIGLIVAELDRRQRLRKRPGSPPWPVKPGSLGPDKAAVKAALTIEAYLERRGVLLNNQKGRAWACCPLPGHEDGSPSFAVDIERQLFYCFGCNRGGDIFTLHQHMIGDPGFLRAITELAAEAGISNRGAS